MKVDSLDELKSAFGEWRRWKTHAREPMPEELLAWARRATKKHGVTAVVRATRVERARLFRSKPALRKAEGATSKKTKGVPRSVPTYSRLELGAPPRPAPSAASPRPIAEVVTVSGATLRMFEQTPEVMGLLTAVCGVGGTR